VQAARALPGNPLPAYPEAAREDGLHGQVQLQVALDAQGRVTAVHWLRRSGVLLLDLAARDAVQAWRFEPARRGGEAVAGSLALSIRFQLDAPVSASTLASTAP
jgi:protein TonB